MNQTRTYQEGFSAAELLITLFIAAIFLIAGNQLYVVVLDQSTYSDKQSIANTAAAAVLSKTIHNIDLYPEYSSCSALPSTLEKTWAYGPYNTLDYTLVFSCPDVTQFPDLRSLTVTAIDTNQKVTASRATYYTQP